MRLDTARLPPLLNVSVFLMADLMVVTVAGIFLAAPIAPWVRSLVALPLVMFLPGTAILRVVKPNVSGLAGCALAVALSFSMTVLGGLTLGLMGWLWPGTWLSWLGGVTLLADYLGGSAGAPFRTFAETASEVVRPFRNVRPRHVVLCVVTLIVAVYTVQNATSNVAAWFPYPFTDFWMLPANRVGNLYTVGIRNGERRGAEQFTVRVAVDNRIVATWSTTVQQDETISRTLALPVGRKAVVWLLRGSSHSQIYREVSASLPGTVLGEDH